MEEKITISTGALAGDPIDIITAYSFSRADLVYTEEFIEKFNNAEGYVRSTLRIEYENEMANYRMASPELALANAKKELIKKAISLGASKVSNCQVQFEKSMMSAMNTHVSEDQYPAYTAFITGTCLR